MGFLDNTKDVVKIIQQMGNIDLYKKVLDIQKEEMDLIEENRNLKNKLHELKKQREIENSLTFFEDKYYFKKEGSGEPTGDPMCSVCYDTKKLTVKLHTLHHGEMICRNCGNVPGSGKGNEVYVKRPNIQGIGFQKHR